MKILLGILSCKAHADRQKAQRETWKKDIPCKEMAFLYFVGHQDNLALDEVYLGEDKIAPEQGLKLYPTLPNKTRALCRWSLEHDYDYLFKTDTDTLVNPKNLLKSDFQASDFSGAYNHEDEVGDFASGGAGYWLSAKAMKIVAESTVTSWAEDLFVTLALREKGIAPVLYRRRDRGYRWEPGEVIDKDMISWHIPSCLRRTGYDPAWMYEYYNLGRLRGYF